MQILSFFIIFFVSFFSFSQSPGNFYVIQTIKEGNITGFKSEKRSLRSQDWLKVVDEGETESGNSIFQLMAGVDLNQREFALEMEEIARELKNKDAWLLKKTLRNINKDSQSLEDIILEKKNRYARSVFLTLQKILSEALEEAQKRDNRINEGLTGTGFFAGAGGVVGASTDEFSLATSAALVVGGLILGIGSACYRAIKDSTERGILRRQERRRRNTIFTPTP